MAFVLVCQLYACVDSRALVFGFVFVIPTTSSRADPLCVFDLFVAQLTRSGYSVAPCMEEMGPTHRGQNCMGRVRKSNGWIGREGFRQERGLQRVYALLTKGCGCRGRERRGSVVHVAKFRGSSDRRLRCGHAVFVRVLLPLGSRLCGTHLPIHCLYSKTL